MYEINSNDNFVKLTREELIKAELKCKEARKLVKKSIEELSPNTIYQAIELYIEASVIYPKLAEPYLSLSYICLEYGKISESSQLLNKLLEFDPSNKKALKLLEKVEVYRNKINKLNDKIEKVDLTKKNNIIIFDETNIKTPYTLESLSIDKINEAKSTELKAKIKAQNFNILTDLFTHKDNKISEQNYVLEKTVTKSQLSQEKIEELEKLRNNNIKDVKIKVGLNSLFMNTLRK